MKKVDKEKIVKLFKDELLTGLRHLYISNDKYGIRVFNDYHITKTNDGYYSVSRKQWSETRVFLNVKNAMSYCVLHNTKCSDTARRLYELDCKLSSVNLDVLIHTRGYKNIKNSLDVRLIQLTKLQYDLDRKRGIVTELQKHINTSKEEQRKIFENVKKNRHKKRSKSTTDDKYIYSSTDY